VPKCLHACGSLLVVFVAFVLCFEVVRAPDGCGATEETSKLGTASYPRRAYQVACFPYIIRAMLPCCAW
jgi:hypothetical protein